MGRSSRRQLANSGNRQYPPARFLVHSPLNVDELVESLAASDAKVRADARKKLLDLGPDAVPLLRQRAAAAAPRTRAGLWGILREINKRGFRSELRKFAADPQSVSLERAALALSGIDNPDLDADSYATTLNRFSSDLTLMLDPESETAFNLEAFQNFMAGELGFSGNPDDYYDPANSFVDQVIDRRSGIPITLSLIYLVVGSNAGLRVDGIGLPGHFIVRFGEARDEIYLDPFHGGRVLSRRDCERIVARHGFAFHKEYLKPVTPKTIVSRMCRNLVNAYSFRQAPTAVREYYEIERLVSS